MPTSWIDSNALDSIVRDDSARSQSVRTGTRRQGGPPDCECITREKATEDFLRSNRQDTACWDAEKGEALYYMTRVNSPWLNNTYAFTFFNEDSIVRLYRQAEGNWSLADSIHTGTLHFWGADPFRIPAVNRQDLNGDGVCDVSIAHSTNINGNAWCDLWVVDTLTRQLDRIKNLRCIANPKYDPRRRVLQSITMAGVFGLHMQELYRWKDGVFYPYQMLEEDLQSGEYAEYRYYIGKDQQWKLSWKKRVSGKKIEKFSAPQLYSFDLPENEECR